MQATVLDVAAGDVQVAQDAITADEDGTDALIYDLLRSFDLVSVNAIFVRDVDVDDGLAVV
jgi:hypothetical protein